MEFRRRAARPVRPAAVGRPGHRRGYRHAGRGAAADRGDRLGGAVAVRYQGWEGRRLTATFGWRYDFEDGSFRPAEPIPDWLLPLRERAASFAGLEPAKLAQALLIRYDPGAGIGWHKDRPVFEHVVGISLGATATMRFRRRRPEGGFDRQSVPLAPRSAYHLSGEARHGWEHSIPEMDATRWSVTFRSLSGR